MEVGVLGGSYVSRLKKFSKIEEISYLDSVVLPQMYPRFNMRLAQNARINSSSFIIIIIIIIHY